MEVQIPVDAVDSVRPSTAHLVGADEQPVDFLPVVARGARIANDGQFGAECGDLGHRFGDEVLVNDRHDGHVEPDHRPELWCVVPGRVDDVLAVDDLALRIAVGSVATPGRIGAAPNDCDIPGAIGPLRHAGDERVAHDPAAEIPGTLGHGVRAARRVGPAVLGCVEAETDVVEIGEQRVPLGDLIGPDEVRLHADLGEHGVDVVMPVGLVDGTCQPDRPAAMPPC